MRCSCVMSVKDLHCRWSAGGGGIVVAVGGGGGGGVVRVCAIFLCESCQGLRHLHCRWSVAVVVVGGGGGGVWCGVVWCVCVRACVRVCVCVRARQCVCVCVLHACMCILGDERRDKNASWNS